MPYPRFQRARNFKFVKRDQGDIVVSSTAWTDVLVALDLTIDGTPGDVLEVALAAVISDEPVVLRLDVVTVVGAQIISSFGSATNGLVGWRGLADAVTHVNASGWFSFSTGDLVGTLVTVRLRAKLETAGTKTILANVDNPLVFLVRNLGPADPT